MVDSEKLAGKSLRSTLSCLAGFFSLESSHVISTAACLVQFLLQWEGLVFHSLLDPYSKSFAELSPLRSSPSNGGRAPSCVAMFGRRSSALLQNYFGAVYKEGQTGQLEEYCSTLNYNLLEIFL